jgi:hypothetical protein
MMSTQPDSHDQNSGRKTPLPKTGAPAQRALEGAGIHALEDLHNRSEREIAALHGMGPKALGILKQALAERGLALRP